MALPLGNWLRLSLVGSMINDTWSINFWFRALTTTDPSATDLLTWCTSAVSDFDAKVWSIASTGLKLSNAPYCSLTGGKALFYSDSVLVQSASSPITPIAGTGSSIHPPYTALVATLLTAKAGRRFRGRAYLPVTGLGVSGTTGQQSGSPTAFATNLRNWLANSNSWTTWSGMTGAGPLVMTQTGSLPENITAVRVDTRFDTQRGRENKLIPTSTSTVAL